MLGPFKLSFALASIERIILMDTGFHGRELSSCFRPPFSTKERKGESVTSSQ